MSPPKRPLRRPDMTTTVSASGEFEVYSNDGDNYQVVSVYCGRCGRVDGYLFDNGTLWCSVCNSGKAL